MCAVYQACSGALVRTRPVRSDIIRPTHTSPLLATQERYAVAEPSDARSASSHPKSINQRADQRPRFSDRWAPEPWTEVHVSSCWHRYATLKPCRSGTPGERRTWGAMNRARTREHPWYGRDSSRPFRLRRHEDPSVELVQDVRRVAMVRYQTRSSPRRKARSSGPRTAVPPGCPLASSRRSGRRTARSAASRPSSPSA